MDSVDYSSEVWKSERSTEDSSQSSTWLSRLGLSSRLAEYSDLLRSIKSLSSCSSETVHSCTSCISVGISDVVRVSSQELTLSDVGLNALMSMKRSASTSPRSVLHRSWVSDNKAVPCISVSSSSTQCHALIAGRASVTESKSEMCTYSSSVVALSSGLLKSASVPERDSVFLSTSGPTRETSCGCCEHLHSAISTEVSCELLKLPTIPSVVVTSDASSVFVATSAPALETRSNCDNFVLNFGIVSASSPSSTCSAVWKASTPARRPQSLDVIPWGSLSPSACKLTGSVSTVVHSRVASSSGKSAVTEVIPASPVNIPAV